MRKIGKGKGRVRTQISQQSEHPFVLRMNPTHPSSQKEQQLPYKILIC